MKNKAETKKVMFEQIVKGIDGGSDIGIMDPNEKHKLLGFGASGLHGYSYVIYDENPNEIVVCNQYEELFRISIDSELLVMLDDLISFVSE